jgi:hypothetical protein
MAADDKLTIYAVARELCVSPVTIRRLLRARSLGCVRVTPRRVVIFRTQLETYLQARRFDACPENDIDSSANSGYRRGPVGPTTTSRGWTNGRTKLDARQQAQAILGKQSAN